MMKAKYSGVSKLEVILRYVSKMLLLIIQLVN